MKVKLVKSLIGRSPTQHAAAKALGLKKIGDTAEVADHPASQGQYEKIKFLLEVAV
jgi:large subunit ribosomal protein L30